MTVDSPDLYYSETQSAGVQERDIDLLVVEELASSIEFVHWFCEKVKGSLPATLGDVDVKHSCLHIGEGYGESDIVLRIKDQEGCSHIYLIEDKIDATFMPNQAERYRMRMNKIIEIDLLGSGKTVLLAPQSFLDSRISVAEFDVAISYELLIEYFDKQSNTSKIPELTHRYTYRRDFIQRAIDKKKNSGVVLEPDPRVCDFRAEYYSFVTSIAPELKLKPLSKVKEPNHWIYYPASLADAMQKSRFLLIHKPYDRVVIQITVDPVYMDRTIEKFAELCSSEPDMSILKADKSFTVCIMTSGLDTRQAFSEQTNEVEQAIKKLLRLRDWYNQNRSVLHALLDNTD